VIVDLGVPPGFDVNTDDFDNLVKAKTLQKYSWTDRQIIVSLNRVDASQPIEMK
jgi:hypothetical protein